MGWLLVVCQPGDYVIGWCGRSHLGQVVDIWYGRDVEDWPGAGPGAGGDRSGPGAGEAAGGAAGGGAFCRRLRIAEWLIELCPVRQVAPITHGQVIEALVANRLTSPAPLVHVEAGRGVAVDEAFGVEPGVLNDDRLGRALDAIAPHLDEVAGSVGAAAIASSGSTWPGCTGT